MLLRSVGQTVCSEKDRNCFVRLRPFNTPLHLYLVQTGHETSSCRQPLRWPRPSQLSAVEINGPSTIRVGKNTARRRFFADIGSVDGP